jgi:16S rRNA (guanine966-N2)-methyltransferase
VVVRIIAGEWRGRRIEAPRGTLVRPTADRVREAWMSIVRQELPEALVLDLCAGSGALGLEALSRGAAHCDFVERAPRSLQTLERNVATLGAGERARIIRADALRHVAGLAPGAYDVAFADPPYADDTAAALAERWAEVPFAHLLGIEHPASVALPGGADTRRYGDIAITFFR